MNFTFFNERGGGISIGGAKENDRKARQEDAVLTQRIIEKDLNAIEKYDFSQYSLDSGADPGPVYGESVHEGKTFVDDDVRFAVFDLAWRVRVEDKLGGDTFEKVKRIIKDKDDRFGFVFAYTLLNSTYSLTTEDEKLSADRYERRTISEALQSELVKIMTDHVANLELTPENEAEVLEDLGAVGSTIGRGLENMDGMEKWMVEDMFKKHRSIGSGYLSINNLEVLYKSIENLKDKGFGINYLRTDLKLDEILSRREDLKEKSFGG